MTQLLDRHFIYPHDLATIEVRNRVKAILDRSPNAATLDSTVWGQSQAITRWCREYDLNPLWPLLSMQREEALLGTAVTDVHRWWHALGYVGQDGPGTANDLWDGLELQAWLNIRQSAWLAGFGIPASYGVRQDIRPQVNRWDPARPTSIQLFTAPNVKGDLYTPTDMPHHIVFSYTPHLEAWDVACQLVHQFTPEFE